VLYGLVGVLTLGVLLWRRRRPARALTGGQQADSGAREVDADWIYGDRGRKANLRESEEQARREAEAIVADAERRAREIVAEAERVRSQVEADLARERADLAEKSKKLSDLLAETIEEVERTSANGSGTTSTHDLEELEALHDELRGNE
jgi:vacuolar-type H+-ATPase subunit H